MVVASHLLLEAENEISVILKNLLLDLVYSVTESQMTQTSGIDHGSILTELVALYSSVFSILINRAFDPLSQFSVESTQ